MSNYGAQAIAVELLFALAALLATLRPRRGAPIGHILAQARHFSDPDRAA
jgi:hypothetical protein